MILQPAVSQAAGVFDNGAPDQVSGNEMTKWLQCEDFKLTGDIFLTDVHFWTFEKYYPCCGGTAWDGTLEYYIFSDDNGKPGNILYFGDGQNIAKTATGLTHQNFIYKEYSYDFDFEEALPIIADTVYWLGLHLSSDYRNQDKIYWETTNAGLGAFGSTGEQSYRGNLDNWCNNNQHHAFYLTPEPGTLILLGLGATILRIRNRR